MRDLILNEIRKLAAQQGGTPPGKGAFARATGITEAKWSGVLWARWSDALADAGFAPNRMKGRSDSKDMLLKVAELCRELKRLPTRAEMKLKRRRYADFPSHGAVSNHFPTSSDLISALSNLGAQNEFSDLLTLIPMEDQAFIEGGPVAREGSVYLIKSGAFYKIGRSDNLEKRVREIRIALPETMTLIHAIRTDDPAGIEAYWHRRFADRRANGEWFKLSADEVKAFSRRSFQ